MAAAEKGGGRRGSKNSTESRSGADAQPDFDGTDQSASLTSVEGSSAGQDASAISQATDADTPGRYGVQGSGGNEAFGGGLGQASGSTAGDSGSSGTNGGDQGGTAASVASGVKQFVRDTAYEQLGSQKQRATEQLGTIAQAVRQSTEQLRQNQPKAAEYVDRAANQIEQFSSSLRDRDLNELLEDVTRFARRQPAVFIGTAFGIGLLAARFLKSSSQGRSSSRYGQGGSRKLQSSWSRGSDAGAQESDEAGSSWSSASRGSGARSSEPSSRLPGSESGV